MGKRVIICGSRSWPDPWRIQDRLTRLPAGTVLVHGGSPGPEEIAVKLSWQLQLRTEEHLPDREAHGNYAEKVRDRHIALLGADLCLVFWDGTSQTEPLNMIDEAGQAGIPIEVITFTEVEDLVVAGDIPSLMTRGFRLREG